MALNPDLFTALYKPDVLMCLADLSNDEVFTPPDIANQVLDMLPQELFRDPNTKFLDPGLKSGVFLREIAKRLIAGLADKIPNLQERCDWIFKNQLYGIAITELTSLLGRRSVYCSKYPNSPFSITKFENIQGNILYHKIRHRWDHAGANGKCMFCGATYDGDLGDIRREGLETHAYEFIHTVHPEEIFDMKFDVIVSNPPYQLNVGVKKENYAVPIYQKFIEQAQKLNPRYLVMITPSRWFTGGRGLDAFRKNMLNDKRLRKIVDFPDSKECFPGVDVAGGVNYFLWDREYNGPCEFVSSHDGKKSTCIRELNEFSVFPRYNEALSIIHKVTAKKEKTLAEYVSTQTPFGFITTFRGKEKPFPGSIELISSGNLTYVGRKEVLRSSDWIDKFKVIISKATCEHAGVPDKTGKFRVISTNRIINPGQICTQSYLVAGAFDTSIEATNYLDYIRTNFVRFLLLQALTSQDISREKFLFVPAQDFKKKWTDAALYQKYNLTNEEISFIESMIRPMDTLGGE